MTKRNIMIIGVGFHARRIYIPKLKEISTRFPINLIGGVDISSQKESIEGYLTERKFELEMLYLESFDPAGELPADIEKNLDAFAKQFDIEGVVISTEPLTHKIYAAWALKNNLHILMDKPISIRKSVGSDISQAKGLIDDFEYLLDLYNKTQKVKPTIFSINVQRRYDNGFEKVKQLIAEARDKFNVPPTSIQAMHADGTWIFPKEVLSQSSHPYLYGYGKNAHSGYHIFDIVWQFYEAGLVEEKRPDALETISSFLTPAGFEVDVSEKDYQNYFGNEYQSTELALGNYGEKVKQYGEIDSFSLVRLLKGGENICNISINLLHSSFSNRAWAIPNKDLYKGNGRIKHQQFIIQQGPFQCIHIHNYQSKDLHDVDNSDEFDVGGNNHFDIYVFRNVKMFGSGKSFEKISSKDLEKGIDGQLVIEKVKDRVILEFINFMLGTIDKKDLKSNIDTQMTPVKIMSGIYQSNVKMNLCENPLIKINL